jgi:hypothetical protein
VKLGRLVVSLSREGGEGGGSQRIGGFGGKNHKFLSPLSSPLSPLLLPLPLSPFIFWE